MQDCCCQGGLESLLRSSMHFKVTPCTLKLETWKLERGVVWVWYSLIGGEGGRSVGVSIVPEVHLEKLAQSWHL